MGELERDLVAGKKVLSNYLGSSNQGRDSDSALIFWRWSYQALARDAKCLVA